MKSEPHAKATKISVESEDNSSDVDDPSEKELTIITDTPKRGRVNEKTVKKNTVGENLSESNCEEDEDINEEDESLFDSENDDSVQTGANFFFEELTSDDEILTFQCPKNFDISALLNQKLNFNDVTKIKIAGNKFKCQILESNKKTLTCVFPKKTNNAALINMPVAGHILIKESIKMPKKNMRIEEIEKTDRIKINNSIVRHPLLGKDWDEHMKIIRKHIKEQKKLFKKALDHKKSLVKAEKERKEQKKILRAQLSLLKKTLSTEAL